MANETDEHTGFEHYEDLGDGLLVIKPEEKSWGLPSAWFRCITPVGIGDKPVSPAPMEHIVDPDNGGLFTSGGGFIGQALPLPLLNRVREALGKTPLTEDQLASNRAEFVAYAEKIISDFKG